MPWISPFTEMSSRGRTDSYWRFVMPKIPEAVLESVIYLYPSVADAEVGKKAGGTGFLVGVPEDEKFRHRDWGAPSWNEWEYSRHLGSYFLHAVTAAHVIHRGSSPVVRLTLKAGTVDIIDLPAEAWHTHPDGDDVAICPIGFSGQYEGTSFVPESFLLTTEAKERALLGPGDEAFFVGRFVGHDGRQRNVPTVRFGNIAMMPEKIQHPGSGSQESFLVEMRSLPGYSGSPVFVYDSRIELKEPRGGHIRSHKWYHENPWYRQPTVAEQIEAEYAPLSQGWLLGIDWAHLKSDDQPVLDRQGDPVEEGWYVQQNSGMMAVVPAWKLDELLHDEEIETMRDEAKQHAREKKSTVELDVAAEEYSRADFLADLRKATKRSDEEKPSRSDQGKRGTSP